MKIIKKKKYFNYDVYENGEIYSYYSNKFLKESIVQGYVQYSLYLNGKVKRIKAHKLVALLFLENDNPEENIVVNHIDGNKRNNHYSNLEWCTYYHNNRHARETKLNDVSKNNSDRWKNNNFKEKTSHSISLARQKEGAWKGKANPKFRYIILQNNKEITKTEAIDILSIAESTFNTRIREYCQGKIHPSFIEHNIKIIDTHEKG